MNSNRSKYAKHQQPLEQYDWLLKLYNGKRSSCNPARIVTFTVSTTTKLKLALPCTFACWGYKQYTCTSRSHKQVLNYLHNNTVTISVYLFPTDTVKLYRWQMRRRSRHTEHQAAGYGTEKRTTPHTISWLSSPKEPHTNCFDIHEVLFWNAVLEFLLL